MSASGLPLGSIVFLKNGQYGIYKCSWVDNRKRQIMVELPDGRALLAALKDIDQKRTKELWLNTECYKASHWPEGAEL